MAGAARASPQLVYATLVLALVVSAHVSVLVRAQQDTLAADRPLSGDAKLVSRGGKFAPGFFQPDIYAHVLYCTQHDYSFFLCPSTRLEKRSDRE